MRKISYILLLSILASITCAQAANESISKLPEYIMADWENTQQFGEARFSRFGIHIYDASFWSLATSNEANKLQNATALSIQYARNIKAKRLLSSTLKEWKRLGFANQHPLDAWLSLLEEIWPDVKPGDRLIFISSEDGSNAFYSSHKKLGSIDDKQFSSAFLDIWLSPNAKYQKHRKELLGETL